MASGELERARDIASCLELAILLESSAHKPGNVSVVTNFEDTRYEHFLASAVAARPSFELAAERGITLSKGEIRPCQLGVGEIIRDGVKRIGKWQRGGNTLLGTVILLSPMAVAAGMSRHEEGRFEIPDIRRNLKDIV